MAQIYSDTTWERWYGEANRHENPWHYNHSSHYDGGLLTLLYPDQDAFLTSILKTDVNGNLRWVKQFNASVKVAIASISISSDGGVLGAGQFKEEGKWANPLILKLNVCGELEWCTKISFIEYSYAVDIKEDNNGDYIALIYYVDAYQNDICQLYKFDPDGNVIWHHSYATKDNYPLIENLEITGIDISEDNSYYLSGLCVWPKNNDPNGILQYRPTIIKVNENGEEEWLLTHEVESELGALAWKKTFELESGHFTCFITDLGVGNIKPGALKFDEFGNVESSYFETILEDQVEDPSFSSIINVNENIFTGYLNFYLGPPPAPVQRGLITFDEEINIISYSIDEDFIFPFGTFKSHDSKFMNIASWPNAQGTEFTDVYMAKYNEDLSFADTINDTNWNYDSLCPDAIENGYIQLFCDVIGLDEDIHANENFNIEVQVSPNPAQNHIEIKIEEVHQIESISLEIFDISGRICFQGNLKEAQRVEQVNIEDWELGMYLVSIKSAGLVIASSKFVKQ